MKIVTALAQPPTYTTTPFGLSLTVIQFLLGEAALPGSPSAEHYVSGNRDCLLIIGR